MQGQLQDGHAKRIDWANIRYHFQHSTYIGVVWDWFLVLSAKLADPFLLLSILYAGFKVTNPDLASHVWSGIDAAVNVGQNIALDAAGFGLLAMAAQAEKDGNEKGATSARLIGYTLLAMMVINMGLASLARSFGWQEQDYAWLIGILLIARAVLSVAYGVVSRSLRKDEKTSERKEGVSTVSVLERVDRVEGTLRDIEGTYRRQFNIMTEAMQHLDAMKQINTNVVAHVEAPDMQATTPPLHLQAQPAQKAQRSTSPRRAPSEGFNKKQFVFDCLKDNPGMKIAEIQEQALKVKQTLSTGTISTYRKQYIEGQSTGTRESEVEQPEGQV